MRRWLAAGIALLCGVELVVAVVISGAGLTALAGWEAGIVALALLAVVGETIRRRRASAVSA